MDNESIADIFSEIAVLLEIKGENPFKSRAYVNAARTLETMEVSVVDLVKSGSLGEIKGFGEAIQAKLTEWVETGKLEYYENLKASVPEGLLELLSIPGLGGKKVKALYAELDIKSINELEQACRDGQVAKLSGFGERTQVKILEGIQFLKDHASTFRIVDALEQAEPILDALRSHEDTLRCSTAGSLRRHKEIIGDMDFLVSSNAPDRLISFFVSMPCVKTILAQGKTKASVILKSGIQADLRVVQDVEFPYALAYFTGSKEHNVRMRQRAGERGLRLNEYGLLPSDDSDPSKSVVCHTEEDLFKKLDLTYIPPELREDNGEFLLAEKGAIPRLIEWTDLKGSLHNHSNWSDGRDSLETIALAMEEQGCVYWAITDHSRSSFQARGLDEGRLLKQIDAIRETNTKLKDKGHDIRLLTGSEVDILTSGKLDFNDDLLAQLEVVVASIHNGFGGSESEMTQRLVHAAENPFVHMLGHLTGRLLLGRAGYKVNAKAVIDACAETGTWIELNASPYRFDMDWRLWSYARSRGVKCVINCDAHRLEHVSFLKLGSGIARKGGLTKADVINTLSLKELMTALGKKRKA